MNMRLQDRFVRSPSSVTGSNHRAGRTGRPKKSAAVSGIVIAALLGGSPTAIAGQAWSADWYVVCPPEFEWALEQVVGEQLAIAWCDDSSPVGVASASRRQLRGTSAWLYNLGFSAPVVRRLNDRNMAFLDNRGWESSGRVEANGVYYPNGHMVLNTPAIAERYATEAHELAHAIQNGHAPSRFAQLTNADQWVWEGTARAIERAWALKPGSGRIPFWEDRSFDHALHRIPMGRRGPAYGTSVFWIDVGRQLRAPDWVGYLPEIYTEMASGGESLAAVDRVLERLLPTGPGDPAGGMQRAFPEFVRFVLSEPDEAAVWFENVDAFDVSVHGNRQKILDRPGAVEPIAAAAHLVSVHVPAGLIGGLRIEILEDTPGHEDLHLIVDRGRYNRRSTPDATRLRNVFATTLSGSDEPSRYLVRVANVSRMAVASKRRDYTLRVTLSTNDAVADATGSEAVNLDDGVLFMYANANWDAEESAAAAQAAMIDRYADHAGLPEDSEHRAAIIAAIEGAEAADAAEAQVITTPPADPMCIATITVFNDDARAVAKIAWRGTGPLMGHVHSGPATFGGGLHDAVYSKFKSAGHEISLIDDPEALGNWSQELRGVTMPGVEEIAAASGKPEATEITGMVADALRAMAFTPPREGEAPAAQPGAQELGRRYESEGWIKIEESAGDRVVGEFGSWPTGRPRTAESRRST